ncbi:MAG: TRAP transporter small permease subunit [SAR324 cluster bacterium]|nr:TRAP transporter small permease subunit [SAR324 cluster bacterium]
MKWHWLFDLDRRIGYMEIVLLSIILIGTIVLYAIQTVLRNAFSTGFLWIDPLVQYSMLWITMLGGSIATLDQHHMSVDLTNKFLSPVNRHRVAIVTSLLSAFVVWFMASAGMDFVRMMQDSNAVESHFLPIPQSISRMIIPLGFYMMMLRFVLRALEHALILLNIDVGQSSASHQSQVL